MTLPLSKQELEKAAKGFNSWEFKEEALRKTFTFKTFRDAITFITRISVDIDELNHHPEITNLYNKVSVLLTTHDAANRVIEKDIRLAGKIQETADIFLDSKTSEINPSAS